jgi:RNA polymerase sigma-70 factor (ECF subfamily)
LIERYGPAIWRQARFSLRDNLLRRMFDEADVCQSVLGEFFFGLKSGQFELNTPEQLLGLLREMVRKQILRQARYWSAGCRDYRRSISRDNPKDLFEPVSPEPSPSRVVANAELLAEVERRLTDEERRILAMRRQGMSWAEVASQFDDAGAEAIRKRFERVLARIGRELKLGD